MADARLGRCPAGAMLPQQLLQANLLGQQQPLRCTPTPDRGSGVQCQVLGCAADLEGPGMKAYFRKNRICPQHLRAAAVYRRGSSEQQLWRYCQQCSKLELLTEFEGAKKSCRISLIRRAEKAAARHAAEISSAASSAATAFGTPPAAGRLQQHGARAASTPGHHRQQQQQLRRSNAGLPRAAPAAMPVGVSSGSSGQQHSITAVKCESQLQHDWAVAMQALPVDAAGAGAAGSWPVALCGHAGAWPPAGAMMVWPSTAGSCQLEQWQLFQQQQQQQHTSSNGGLHIITQQQLSLPQVVSQQLPAQEESSVLLDSSLSGHGLPAWGIAAFQHPDTTLVAQAGSLWPLLAGLGACSDATPEQLSSQQQGMPRSSSTSGGPAAALGPLSGLTTRLPSCSPVLSSQHEGLLHSLCGGGLSCCTSPDLSGISGIIAHPGLLLGSTEDWELDAVDMPAACAAAARTSLLQPTHGFTQASGACAGGMATTPAVEATPAGRASTPGTGAGVGAAPEPGVASLCPPVPGACDVDLSQGYWQQEWATPPQLTAAGPAHLHVELPALPALPGGGPIALCSDGCNAASPEVSSTSNASSSAATTAATLAPGAPESQHVTMTMMQQQFSQMQQVLDSLQAQVDMFVHA